MFLKLVMVILGIGVIACALLTVRQQRLQAVNELANVQRNVVALDRTLAELRLEVAARTSPQNVGRLRAHLPQPEPPLPAPSGAGVGPRQASPERSHADARRRGEP